MKFFSKWKRFRKSAQDYGLQRALAKAAGRLGLPLPHPARAMKNTVPPSVSVVGCGQAAYATICYFLQKNFGNLFLDCYDPVRANAEKLKQAYGFCSVANDFETLLLNPELKTLVIASNHASHTDYAIAALERGLDVFCEKPISVSFEQLHCLRQAVQQSKGRFHAGFNRPFAPAIQKLGNHIQMQDQSTIQFHAVVHGHQLDEDHWYNRPEEGTRISGNLGHWIDLAVHLMYKSHPIPEWFDLHLAASGTKRPFDNNLVLTINSSADDLFNLALFSQHEPFSGIRENIFYHSNTLSAQIDDFRSLKIWSAVAEEHFQYKRKDPGHEALLKACFSNTLDAPRNLDEVWLSTALTLHAAEMAWEGNSSSRRIYTSELHLVP